MKGRSHLLTKQARAALISSFSPASALHPKVISAPRCRKISAPPPPTASHTCALPIPSLSAHFLRSRPLFAGVKRHLRCRFWRARHSVVNSSSGRDGRSACRSQPPDGAAAWPFSCDRVAARLACRRWFFGSYSLAAGSILGVWRRVCRAESGQLAARCDRGVKFSLLPVV